MVTEMFISDTRRAIQELRTRVYDIVLDVSYSGL